MAMNKKEQAEMAALRRAVLVAGAFKRTERVLPDVVATNDSGMVFGFARRDTVTGTSIPEPAWSDTVSHGYGTKADAERPHRSGSQNAKRMYSTMLRALMAHRWELEQQYANQLADIDEAIERERAAAPQKKEG